MLPLSKLQSSPVHRRDIVVGFHRSSCDAFYQKSFLVLREGSLMEFFILRNSGLEIVVPSDPLNLLIMSYDIKLVSLQVTQLED